ncbi:MAG: hypothetical protein QHH15_07625, partial [Candidatus Thermoplasmatota archaeon]|nr:hypothetical protein [Candidatus Thermoplasmatota archaeon]
MKLPEQIKLLQDYLKEKKCIKNKPKEYECIVFGLDKNILIVSTKDNVSFTDKGFFKNDLVDFVIQESRFSGIIKEIYSNYCYIEISAKDLKITVNDTVILTDSVDTSFLYKNMFNAYLKIFKKNQYKKLKEFFIKVYSEKKLETPIRLKSFIIKPPSRQKPGLFFNKNLDEPQKELVSACLNLINDEDNL